MDKIIKMLLAVVGVILIVYGVYRVVVPEVSVDIGITEFNSQDNKNAYISLGVGFVVLIISLFMNKK
ncbi:hypothetical protein [Pseudofulvibacter geojedonensis]|uniref:Arginyl-tRNA synthetase n=1 Tax=Pseudofulvibacter geojedonensis TaxID=1123758 RepID=A0ABW3I4G3_9FLAO